MNKNFSKDEMKMCKTYRNILSSLDFIEVEMKTNLSFFICSIKTTIIKKTNNNKWWKRYRIKYSLCHLRQECKFCDHYGNKYSVFQKVFQL